ncbi:MAG: hypothetical protein Q7U02_01580, partial [Desulfosalsimonadaceae bacterium]|nr:hypothetical protein [Desulfosalsimonadaceae bacterium]
MNKFKFFSLVLIAISSTACLFSKPIDVIIQDTPFYIGPDSIEIKCDPPLRRTRESADIFLITENSYNLVQDNEFKALYLSTLKISIALRDSDGEVINTPYYGTANHNITGNFSKIPKSKKIKSVIISSTKKITVLFDGIKYARKP